MQSSSLLRSFAMRTDDDAFEGPPTETVQLLRRLGEGDEMAGEELFGRLYDELRKLARGAFQSQRDDHTLQATALVHETYLKLTGGKGEWKDRQHFLAVAARAMRQILVDHARGKGRQKRSVPGERKLLDSIVDELEAKSHGLVAFDEALGGLARVDERLAKLVEMRFFAGMTVEETARALGVSMRRVESDWTVARAWLRSALS